MTGLRSCIDSSGTYFTNIISQNGRNEIQIYHIDKSIGKPTISQSSTVKVNLDAHETILDYCWVNSSSVEDFNSPKKRAKRNQRDELQNNDEITSVSLVLSIKGGDILIASPNSDKIVNRISNENELFRLSQSLNEDSIYGITENSTIEEISLSSNKLIKGTQFNEDRDITYLKSVKYEIGSKGNKSQYILLGSQNLYLADISKIPRKALVSRFPVPKTNNPITNIIQSNIDANIIYVTRASEKEVYIYNLSDPKFTELFSADSTIMDLQLISTENEEALAIITDKAVQMFNYKIGTRCEILTNHDDARFSNIFLSGTTLMGVWYDVNEPKFTEINWTFSSTGAIKVPIEYNRLNNVTELAENNIIIPDSIEINNLASTELFDKLVSLLNKDGIDQQGIFDLCSSNDDEINIKEAVKLFSTSSDITPDSINVLFGVISSEVARDPSKSTALSIWLKWLLLAHGGYIAKQPQNNRTLKNLQQGLTDGLKVMPILLGIQGRLQLLKAQTELRESLYNNNDDDSEDDMDETEGNITAGTNSESFYFANGENDDFDSADDKEDVLVNTEDGEQEGVEVNEDNVDESNLA